MGILNSARNKNKVSPSSYGGNPVEDQRGSGYRLDHLTALKNAGRIAGKAGAINTYRLSGDGFAEATDEKRSNSPVSMASGYQSNRINSTVRMAPAAVMQSGRVTPGSIDAGLSSTTDKHISQHRLCQGAMINGYGKNTNHGTVSSGRYLSTQSKRPPQGSLAFFRKSVHSTFKDQPPTVVARSYRPMDNGFQKDRNVMALYDYNSTGKDDLPFMKGDRLTILDDRHKDWWYARNIRTHKCGFIPQSYVCDLDDLNVQEWYFENASLREAERSLDQPFNCAGTFIIRPSGSTPGNFALSLLDVQADGQNQVKHYRIQQTSDGRYFIGPKASFATLLALVDYYSEKSEGLCSRLIRPCPKHKPTLPDLSYDDLNQIEIERKSIKLISQIGSGNYGEVWKGRCRGLDVAVKTMKPQKQTAPRGDFLDEARVMKDLHHPNIVRLWGVSTIMEPLYIVFEYMVNGNLLDYLHSDMGKALKLPKIVDVAAQVASGMAYLEKKQLVHCDLAARNILVGEALLVKIGDFGLAKIIRTGKLQVESQTQFPIKWTAPEAATKKEYTIKSDVWSFGILLYELITRGSVPYPGMSNQETLKAVSEGERLSRPHMCPDSFYQVMMSCWNANPKVRPTFEHLYNLFDDFFTTTEPNYKESEDL